MEDKGDKGAGRGGKHNPNFEDHVVFVFVSNRSSTEVERDGLKLSACCVPLGFGADTGICLSAGGQEHHEETGCRSVSWAVFRFYMAGFLSKHSSLVYMGSLLSSLQVEFAQNVMQPAVHTKLGYLIRNL